MTRTNATRPAARTIRRRVERCMFGDGSWSFVVRRGATNYHAQLSRCPRDLSGLQKLLERAKVLLHLALRILADQLRHGRRQLASGRVVAEYDLDLRAASRRRREVHRAGVGDR